MVFKMLVSENNIFKPDVMMVNIVEIDGTTWVTEVQRNMTIEKIKLLALTHVTSHHNIDRYIVAAYYQSRCDHGETVSLLAVLRIKMLGSYTAKAQSRPILKIPSRSRPVPSRGINGTGSGRCSYEGARAF